MEITSSLFSYRSKRSHAASSLLMILGLLLAQGCSDDRASVATFLGDGGSTGQDSSSAVDDVDTTLAPVEQIMFLQTSDPVLRTSLVSGTPTPGWFTYSPSARFEISNQNPYFMTSFLSTSALTRSLTSPSDATGVRLCPYTNLGLTEDPSTCIELEWVGPMTLSTVLMGELMGASTSGRPPATQDITYLGVHPRRDLAVDTNYAFQLNLSRLFPSSRPTSVGRPETERSLWAQFRAVRSFPEGTTPAPLALSSVASARIVMDGLQLLFDQQINMGSLLKALLTQTLEVCPGSSPPCQPLDHVSLRGAATELSMYPGWLLLRDQSSPDEGRQASRIFHLHQTNFPSDVFTQLSHHGGFLRFPEGTTLTTYDGQVIDLGSERSLSIRLP